MLARAQPSHSNGLTIAEARAQLGWRPVRADYEPDSASGVFADLSEGYRFHGLRVEARDHDVLTVALAASDEVEQRRCGKVFVSACRTGEATLMPAGYALSFNGVSPAHVRLALAKDSLRECATTLRQAGERTPELINAFRLYDSQLEGMAKLYAHELSRAGDNVRPLILDCLGAALLVHVVRMYGNVAGVEERSIGRGSARAIRRALQYLHAVQDRPIRLADIAREAGLSTFHFSRLFQQATGFSPVRYLERLRIERAKSLLRGGTMGIAEVAYEVGFADQSHFTRRFRQAEGVTPGEYLREHGRSYAASWDGSGSNSSLVGSPPSAGL